jgi:hypothetical protein
MMLTGIAVVVVIVVVVLVVDVLVVTVEVVVVVVVVDVVLVVLVVVTANAVCSTTKALRIGRCLMLSKNSSKTSLSVSVMMTVVKVVARNIPPASTKTSYEARKRIPLM